MHPDDGGRRLGGSPFFLQPDDGENPSESLELKQPDDGESDQTVFRFPLPE